MTKRKMKVFVGMSGGFGPLSQVLPIIDTFEKDKFDISCYIASASADMVKRLGYGFIDAPYIDPPKLLIPKGYNWWDIDHYWGRFGYIDPEYVNAMITARVDAIKQFDPDFIISQFSPPTEIAAKVLGVPLISVTQSCFHPKGKGVSWWEKPTESYPRATPLVNRVMEKYGLEPINRMEELNRGDLTIMPSFPEFDPVDDDVVYVGPLLWESSSKACIFDVEGLRKKGRKLIFVYTGNLYDSAGAAGIIILQNVIKGLGDSEFDVIVSTGLGQSLEGIGEIPSNIRIFDWVPGSEIIKECDLVIHHGGHGSCIMGIIQGVPSIVIPTFSEREFNARQVKELGVGDFILTSQITPDILFDYVDRSISDKLLYKRAREWVNILKQRAYGGGSEAKERIMEFIFSSLKTRSE